MDASEIKNLQLFELGVDNITDFNSTNPLVLKVNQIYDVTKKSLLSLYRWSFAVKSVELTGVALTDERYEYSFDLPADYLRCENVFGNVKEVFSIGDYRIIEGKLHCNQDTVYLRYIFNVDEEDMPDYFIEAIKYKGAYDLCYNLTGDTDKQTVLQQQFMFFYINAKNVDSRQFASKQIKSKPYIGVRG